MQAVSGTNKGDRKMWKFKKSKTEAAPPTKEDQDREERERNRYLAAEGAEKVVTLADDHLKSLVTTIEDHKILGDMIQETEQKVKVLGEEIDKADLALSETKKAVAEKFDSLSATFTALCEKVKKGNLPTTALVSNDAAEVLQPLNAKRAEVKAQQKAPCAS
jgi:hypothetical protein